MTTRVVARGSDWSADTLYDGWGETPPDQVGTLARRVVSRFEELTAEAGFVVWWEPEFGEVYSDQWVNFEDADTLAELRDQARDEVWAGVVSEPVRLCIMVNESSHGVYKHNPDATPEVWSDVQHEASSARFIETLQGWGRWKEAWWMEFGDYGVVYFVEGEV